MTMLVPGVSKHPKMKLDGGLGDCPCNREGAARIATYA